MPGCTVRYFTPESHFASVLVSVSTVLSNSSVSFSDSTLKLNFPTENHIGGVIDKTVVHRHANMKPAVRVSVANSILSTVGVMSIVLLNTCKRLSGDMDFIIYMFIVYSFPLRNPQIACTRICCAHRSSECQGSSYIHALIVVRF